ncbi:hypothetical protein [Aliamphritea hakodatensis]|uniref:hypothetical protein n=1 Tax=Aliamphritea hakodatensis TaxID=2895352 RepID=UPI0022FD6F6C|nr:hypothetical protein [Aliamphritea hakodatensis]
MASLDITFQLYRYQLLPIDRFLQTSLLNGANTINELIERKNEFFNIALSNVSDSPGKKKDVEIKIITSVGDIYLLKLAKKRKVNVETKQFKKDEIENWPSVYVVVNNHPDIQMIAVQKRTSAFVNTGTVINHLFESLKHTMQGYHLTSLYEPKFESKKFWRLLSMLQKQGEEVHSIEFEIVTANMASISKTLPDDLKAFAKATNSVKTSLKIESDSDASLKLEQSEPLMKGLVDYASEGGGNIRIKLAGISKTHHTSETITEVSVDDLDIEGSAEQAIEALQEIFK